MDAANTCKNCGNVYTGKYCNNCGERQYGSRDRSVKHVVAEGLHFFTHFEGTFFTTVKALFLSPGKLSEDYCAGIRKKYFKPLSLFLLLVVLYLLFPVFEGLNMKLHYYGENSIYGKYVEGKNAAVMAEKNISFEVLSDSFHRSAEKVSKFLLFILIPPLALISWMLGFRKRKFYFDHFVFTIEACSFFILWGFLISPLITLLLSKLINLADSGETVPIVIVAAGFVVYAASAARRFLVSPDGTVFYTVCFFLPLLKRLLQRFINSFCSISQ